MVFKSEKNRRNCYRNTFSSNEGRMVLVDILGTLGFWDTITSQGLSEVEQNVLNLHAKKILERCGFWQPKNYEAIVRNILGIPKKKRKRFFERRKRV